MSVMVTLTATFAIYVATMSGSSLEPWYESIQRFQDCTDYAPVTMKPDGSLVWGEDLKGVEVPFPYTRDDAFKVLLNTCEFKRRTGPGGAPSLQVELLNVLWHQPDRLSVFEDLYKRGNIPGKLHALIGLYVIDRERYTRRLAEFAYGGSVALQTGCATYPVPVGEIVRDIQNGTLAAEFQKVGTYMTWLP